MKKKNITNQWDVSNIPVKVIINIQWYIAIIACVSLVLLGPDGHEYPMDEFCGKH
jgi:hypothetical protein